MTAFDYIISKIENANFERTPFKHLYIENLFSSEHFAELINSPEINIAPVETDEQLIETLYRHNFKEIEFPGTTTNIPAYLKWRQDPASSKVLNQETCEGYGVVMRLREAAPNSRLAAAYEFFRSTAFWSAAASKFELDLGSLRSDSGIQKYLDGYEISPHADIRLKALTFMININPAPNAEALEYNTKYLTLKRERNYVGDFWSSHPSADRCWVPWDWCDVQKIQTANNSIVMFSPANDTMHAVKAAYNHLVTQRTQFYGNLWHTRSTTNRAPNYKEIPVP